jgi:hypothetical protein
VPRHTLTHRMHACDYTTIREIQIVCREVTVWAVGVRFWGRHSGLTKELNTECTIKAIEGSDTQPLLLHNLVILHLFV